MNLLCFLLTLAVGSATGVLFYQRKIPGGMMVGSLIGTAVLGIGFRAAYMPLSAKYAAQLIAGAFIGLSISRDDIRHMRYTLKPILIVIALFLATSFAAGFTVYACSPLDLPTALFGAVPGGMSDIPIIAGDMGANSALVAVLQFSRLLMGIGVLPSMIGRIYKNEPQPRHEGSVHIHEKSSASWTNFTLTMAVAATCGFIGIWLCIPAGALLFAVIGTIAFKLATGRAWLPPWTKRVAQALSGAFIGCTIRFDDVAQMKSLLIPIVIINVFYLANCIICGKMLHHFCHMTNKESMLAATPAGASDMALISMDMGVQSPDLVVIQIMRLIVASAVFPQIFGLLLRLTGYLTYK